jgi:hypothetical protein
MCVCLCLCYAAVASKLHAVIRSAGGSVVRDVDIDTLLFSTNYTTDASSDSSSSSGGGDQRIIGVRLNITATATACNTTRNTTGTNDVSGISASTQQTLFSIRATHGVVSGLGVMHTYLMLQGMRPKGKVPSTSPMTPSPLTSTSLTQPLSVVPTASMKLSAVTPSAVTPTPPAVVVHPHGDPRQLLNACEARPKLYWYVFE